jgi:hypothetical protein
MKVPLLFLESSTCGVSAPLSLKLEGGGEYLGGDEEPGSEISLGVLLPLVAATEGDVGGSGERVK